VWIFGYGSLIFRPSFAFVEQRRAYVAGFTRRFWQGSPDHRGTPERPGRVVTLIADQSAWCGGAAFRIDPRSADAVLAALDAREQAGFERVRLALWDAPATGEPFAEGLTYVATPENAHFLGPLEEPEIARWIGASSGPSGQNADYARALHRALRDLDIHDPHVETIATLLE